VDKHRILSEIKRTAAANGGLPLGERTFYQMTGITKQDWFGKFWPRFSEAVREAGFAPREFSDEKQYSDDEMLSRYAKLAQELGRLPTDGDMRFNKSLDDAFPNSKTFETRFGGKSELVTRLSQFCSGRPEFSGVQAWCENYIAENRMARTDEAPETETGYVYLMRMGKFSKIGKTNDFMRRGREITIQLPEKAEMVHFFRTDDPSGIEAYWHRRFAAKRKEGEWFELNAKDIRAFKRRRNFM
jgi:hypothetical protein